MIKLIHKIADLWWCSWSNVRWRKAIKFYKDIKTEDICKHDIFFIKSVIDRLFSKYNWVADGPDQLWDSISPPPQNYSHYLDGELNDDCDGWSSLVNYVLHYSGIECYLLSVEELLGGHCVSLFKLNDKWYVNDYLTFHGPFNNPKDAIVNYNEVYVRDYKPKTRIFNNGILKYDYEKGKFKICSISKLK